MTAPQQFIQSKLLMSNGLMLTTDEISKLDWSVFDEVDITKQSSERIIATHIIDRQIDKLRTK